MALALIGLSTPSGCILELNPSFVDARDSGSGSGSGPGSGPGSELGPGTGGGSLDGASALDGVSPSDATGTSTVGGSSSPGVDTMSGSNGATASEGSTGAVGGSSSGDTEALPQCEPTAPFVVGVATVEDPPQIALLDDQLGVLWNRARTFERVTLDGDFIGLGESPLGYDVWTTSLLAVDGSFVLTYETGFHAIPHQVYTRTRVAAATWDPPQQVSQTGNENLRAASFVVRGQILSAWRENVTEFGFSVSDKAGAVLDSGTANPNASHRPRRVFEDGADTLMIIEADNGRPRLLRLDEQMNPVDITLLNGARAEFVFEGDQFMMAGVVMGNLVLVAHDGENLVGELTLIESSPAPLGEMRMIGRDGDYELIIQNADAPNAVRRVSIRGAEVGETVELVGDAVRGTKLLDVGDGRYIVSWISREGADDEVMVGVYCW